MSQLWLGRFSNFKGADTVLLDCSAEGIAQLVSCLRSMTGTPRAIHAISNVMPGRQTKLFASAAPIPNENTLVIDEEALADIAGKLLGLAKAGSGHQYFDIVGPSTTLLVSIGEYGEEWWRAHA